MNSKDIGNVGEHLAILECLKLNIIVSRPLGDNTRYDLILDINKILYKVQVKSTSNATDEYAEFFLQSSQIHRGKTRQSYNNDDVDYFILVDIVNNKVFLLDNISSVRYIKIRYKKSPNINTMHWYEDYLLVNQYRARFDS